jgi:hypothetical protein
MENNLITRIESAKDEKTRIALIKFANQQNIFQVPYPLSKIQNKKS